VDALTHLSSCVAQNIEAGKILMLVFIDFSRAFDTVDLGALFGKLASLGISLNLCNMIFSFLDGRPMRVSVGEALSSEWLMGCGVPQGSSCGPTCMTFQLSPALTTLGTLTTPSLVFVKWT